MGKLDMHKEIKVYIIYKQKIQVEAHTHMHC